MKCYYARNHRKEGYVKCTLQGVVEDVVSEYACDNHCPFKKIQMRGLGDLIERILTFFGITKKRYAKITKQKAGGCMACDGRQEAANDLVHFDENGWPHLTRPKSPDNP